MKQATEKPGMTAGEIRELREKERMDSVYYEPPASKKAGLILLLYAAALAVGIGILVGLYYGNILLSWLKGLVSPYLELADNSSGFLDPLMTGVLQLLLFAAVAFLFGFALHINYSPSLRNGRPKEIWGKPVSIAVPAAFAGCAVYVVCRHLAYGSSFLAAGSVLSKVLYYVTMLAVVPAANILLFLVLPSALLRIVLTLLSDTSEKIELPLILMTTIIMSLALLGITPRNLENFGLPILLFTLLQSAVCSVVYHKTNVILYTVLVYSGVSGLYFALAALLNLL